jgi:ATP synthase protein I
LPPRDTRAPLLEARIDETPRKNRHDGSRRLFKAASLASLGLEMGVAVFVGWWFGSWLDRQWDTAPWMMLMFLLFGVAAGFRGLIRAANESRPGKTESNSQRPD